MQQCGYLRLSIALSIEDKYSNETNVFARIITYTNLKCDVGGQRQRLFRFFFECLRSYRRVIVSNTFVWISKTLNEVQHDAILQYYFRRPQRPEPRLSTSTSSSTGECYEHRSTKIFYGLKTPAFRQYTNRNWMFKWHLMS